MWITLFYSNGVLLDRGCITTVEYEGTQYKLYNEKLSERNKIQLVLVVKSVFKVKI